MKDFFNVWFKYQLSLNWFNILFGYCIKLLLVINLLIVLVSFAYKYKSSISEFKYVVAGLVLIDLLSKYKFPRIRQNLEIFHIIPKGVPFIALLNLLLDILSFRNLTLPIFAMVLGLIIEPQYGFSFFNLFILSCTHNLVAGIVTEKRKNIVLFMAFIAAISFIYLPNIYLLSAYLTFAILLVIYRRYGEKQYPKNDTTISNSFISFNSIENPFLWLEFIVLKKSRRQQIVYARVVAICALYIYIISVLFSSESGKGDFSAILLIQTYFSLVPAMLIPYILSSNHSYISLLVTMPNLKEFFMTKFNLILVVQLLLTLILCTVNHSNFQTVFLICSISIFNIFLITPIMFMGILLTDEKVAIFDLSISNSFFTPSFFQSLYFLLIIICSAVILYIFHSISHFSFSLLVVVLGITGFFLRRRFIELFSSLWYKMKYKLVKTLG